MQKDLIRQKLQHMNNRFNFTSLLGLGGNLSKKTSEDCFSGFSRLDVLLEANQQCLTLNTEGGRQKRQGCYNTKLLKQ